MIYECKHCKYVTGSRKLIRNHVKTHGIKGGNKTRKEFAKDYASGASSKKEREGTSKGYTRK